MIYEIILSLDGTNFNPDILIEKINHPFLYTNKNLKGDKKKNTKGYFEFGYVDIYHKNSFATDYQFSEFEKSYVDFIVDNYSLFIENYVQNIDIYIVVYYDGSQCNFNVLSNNQLRRLRKKINLTISVSVHKINQKEMRKRTTEINNRWNDRVNE